MIVMPAIDLRGGACVQLVGGDVSDERVRLPDAVAVARRWMETGFEQLHIVDLDAATESGANEDLIGRILALGARCEVGGGVRTSDRVAALIDSGASRVLVATRALEDPAWLSAEAARRPGRLMLALEVRNGAVVTHGWSREVPVTVDDALDAAAALPLAGVFVTSVDVEGRMGGSDLALIDRVRARTSLPVVASGGIGSVDDLYALRERGVWGAVIGMAFYTGKIDAERVAQEFGR